jgi:metallo-beta-lactamase class B
MNKLIIFLLVITFCVPIFSHQTYKSIPVSNDIKLIQISDNTYIHVTYAQIKGFGRVASNGMIFINNEKAFLFDTPVNDSLTKKLIDYISDSLKLKIVGFIPNHWHSDCMGGLGYLKSIGIPSYANQMTIEIAKTNNLPLPEIGFRDSLTLKLDDKEIKCYFFGAAHSKDNIVVWIPSQKILFAGCLVKEIKSINLGNTIDGDLFEYPKTIEKIIEKFNDAKIIIPGHGEFGGQELLEHTLEMAKKN